MASTTATVAISLPITLINDLKALADEKDQPLSRYLSRVLQAHVNAVKQQQREPEAGRSAHVLPSL